MRPTGRLREVRTMRLEDARGGGRSVRAHPGKRYIFADPPGAGPNPGGCIAVVSGYDSEPVPISCENPR